ncbi:CinA family nicotinamide mononucleotide deamidase-related protein [Riemerella columbina]|uniref:CinA family nicotinamide mononucleotide deamidase-related protein n=1 Tax=Riemerella columbina TaxID=103810 RepID=UPI0003733015|nr:CinA family nicotinamide mononucleotide deamidase-related protein [Riemerella columbina]
MIKSAVLISIGDEILAGNTVDTNSNFIAQQLGSIGIKVIQIFAISDDEWNITKTLDLAFSMADLVVTTGGLGPTKDDKTKKVITQYFKDTLVSDTTTLEHLKQLLIKRNREYLFDINQAQAEVPSKATVFQNDYGTAPCLMMQEDGKFLFVLPGVPFEVKPLMKDKIIPYLATTHQQPYILTQIISVVDFPESLLSQTIEPWELTLPKHIAPAYLPIGNRVKLKLTATGSDLEQLKSDLKYQTEQLKPYIQDKVIAWEHDSIVEILKSVLVEKQWTISCAESCTGGTVAKLLTSISGSSAYFIGGMVAYDKAQKVNLLNVPKDLIDQETTVSEAVAQAMSEGCQKVFDTDIAVSTTGVAGPQTDEFQNTVGEVYFAITIHKETTTHRLYLPYMEREDFINFVSQRVLQKVVERLVKSF